MKHYTRYMLISQYIKRTVAIASLGAALLTSACGPKISNGGYVRDDDIKDKIVVGKSTKEDVHTNLGSPSAQSSFGNESWYYITSRQETVAFLKPQIVKEDVIQIEFDNAGVVKAVNNYDKSNATEFAVATRTTPTEGHTMGFWEQVLGNIGRFNHPSNDSAAPGRQPSPGGF